MSHIGTEQLLPFDSLPIQFRACAKSGRARRVAFASLVLYVCNEFKVSQADLTSKARHRKIARPRQVLMYLACYDTLQSLPWIGRQIGNRDHTTVIHGKRKIEELIDSREEQAIIASLIAIRRIYVHA
jgi:chromosomal replication initiator protein